ncbi:GIY-YIG nuclease family protein [Rouxiella silvae]|uniref:GIY-YIG nuclease family protein n=1 Tax=Rouxiella silvae TaxID=1646373 RepID=A0AA40X074_9GAMM|nr:GIY-YIG nuclease family protein [Rouxiella silvae]MBF6636277.1 GIY-YIG nuclease family protein [Rouxiella silvae]
MLRTPTGMLYTGITTDVLRRLQQHQCGKGAKSLRGKGVLTLVFHCAAGDRSQASQLEYQIKQLSKKHKEILVRECPENIVEYLAVTTGYSPNVII